MGLLCTGSPLRGLRACARSEVYPRFPPSPAPGPIWPENSRAFPDPDARGRAREGPWHRDRGNIRHFAPIPDLAGNREIGDSDLAGITGRT